METKAESAWEINIATQRETAKAASVFMNAYPRRRVGRLPFRR